MSEILIKKTDFKCKIMSITGPHMMLMMFIENIDCSVYFNIPYELLRRIEYITLFKLGHQLILFDIQ